MSSNLDGQNTELLFPVSAHPIRSEQVTVAWMKGCLLLIWVREQPPAFSEGVGRDELNSLPMREHYSHIWIPKPLNKNLQHVLG